MSLDSQWIEHANVVAARVAAQLRDNPPIIPEYLNPRQAATFISFTPKALERMRQRGDGPPYVKIGTRVRYRVDDLRAWLEAGRDGS